MFMRESEYGALDLPKSELAAIQIDTKGNWMQRADNCFANQWKVGITSKNWG